MSAFPSHSSKPANAAARPVGNTVAQLSEGTADNMMQAAENLGDRSVNFTNIGPSVLSALAAPSSAEDVRGGITAGTAAGEKITIRHLPLDEIRVGPRHRQDMGDLQVLADSMGAIGLLQPIGVTADVALVFGERHLRAAQMLGWTTIAARIVDVPSIVAGEYAENEVRKDFTASERVAIADAVRAEMGNRQGQRTDRTEPPENFPEVSKGEKTRAIAARKAGFGNETTYRQAKTVVERGAANVVEAMDRGKVSAQGHRGLRGKSAAAVHWNGKTRFRDCRANRASGAVEAQDIELRRNTLLFAQRPEDRFRANTPQLAQLRSTTIS